MTLFIWFISKKLIILISPSVMTLQSMPVLAVVCAFPFIAAKVKIFY